jgi:MFS family permease
MTQGVHPPAEAFRPLRDWAPTGFTWLLRMHGTQSAGDALVAVSLANTLFFSVPVGEARGRVALYLLVTMAPFAVVAPFIGPLLDRTRSGRRLALAGTMGGRALVVWIMASHPRGLALYPAALGVLVLSRGYAVARAAVLPRVLPRNSTLVGANARVVLTGACAAAVVAPLGAGISYLTSPSLLLRLTALVFAMATYFAFRLPAIVNSEPDWSRDTHAVLPGFTRKVGAAVIGSASLRALAGFLLIFLAFRIKTDGGGTWQLVALIAAAALAGIGGTGLGALARQHEPENLIGGALATATIALLIGMVDYGFVAALGVVAASALAGSLGKLGQDAIIQRDIAEDVRAQAFARSETMLQLAWVAGGAIGLVPLPGGAAFAFAAAAVGAATVFTLRAFRSVRVA